MWRLMQGGEWRLDGGVLKADAGQPGLYISFLAHAGI